MKDEPSIVTMNDLVAALNRVRITKGMTLMELNDIAGLQGGYANKIFCGIKTLGPLSLPAILTALGCELRVVLAPSKMESSDSKRDSYEVFHRKERKKIAAQGGKARAQKLDSKKRREIARLGGLAAAQKRAAIRKLGDKALKKNPYGKYNGDKDQGELF